MLILLKLKKQIANASACMRLVVSQQVGKQAAAAAAGAASAAAAAAA